ncbi:hypothetical protein ADIS_4609 [Lunatimonas lonarensis]|uniref:Uncharacterized protein n=1 Tax=Lunatimonas lonarensis TaxID=1232681 RepID=R7ZLE7_9BACT|nr:hypothetical protein ADIS_4609 [Lunatimonas lonarensis]
MPAVFFIGNLPNALDFTFLLHTHSHLALGFVESENLLFAQETLVWLGSTGVRYDMKNLGFLG